MIGILMTIALVTVHYLGHIGIVDFLQGQIRKQQTSYDADGLIQTIEGHIRSQMEAEGGPMVFLRNHCSNSQSALANPAVNTACFTNNFKGLFGIPLSGAADIYLKTFNMEPWADTSKVVTLKIDFTQFSLTPNADKVVAGSLSLFNVNTIHIESIITDRALGSQTQNVSRTWKTVIPL